MKRTVAVFLFLLIVGNSFAAVYFKSGLDLFYSAQEWNKYFTGQGPPVDFQKVAYFQGYVSGVASTARSRLELPEGVQVDQMCTIVHNYLQDNPRRLHEPASDLVIDALLKAFKKR
jgi:hypothetical protein